MVDIINSKQSNPELALVRNQICNWTLISFSLLAILGIYNAVIITALSFAIAFGTVNNSVALNFSAADLMLLPSHWVTFFMAFLLSVSSSIAAMIMLNKHLLSSLNQAHSNEIKLSNEVVMKMDELEREKQLAEELARVESKKNEDLSIALKQLEKAVTENEIQKQKVKENIYRATVQGSQHILNNLLNQLNLVKVAINMNPDFSVDVANKFNLMTLQASELVNQLATVQEIDEQNIKSSVYPK